MSRIKYVSLNSPKQGHFYRKRLFDLQMANHVYYNFSLIINFRVYHLIEMPSKLCAHWLTSGSEMGLLARSYLVHEAPNKV